MSIENILKKNLIKSFKNKERLFAQNAQLRSYGILVSLRGNILEAEGCRAPIGSNCLVRNDKGLEIKTEVVGFANDRLYLMSSESIEGLSPGDRVLPINRILSTPVSDDFLGRVIDGESKPLDNHAPIVTDSFYPLLSEPRNPLLRESISEVLDVGVKAINAMATIGKGQRMGLFAGSGVGKSVLLGMMTKFTQADVVVVALIGERGREVKEFIEQILGEEGLRRAVVVASPADTSPLMRIRAAQTATTLAEYFRDQGKSVLLLMDSLTRYAQAEREVSLAVGEPPVAKGYPPSVFSKLPQLVERAGNGHHGSGSISAIYTVLSEADDLNDPIVDASRAILDGHIVLSRALAENGHFPAIDLRSSTSRVMMNIVSKEHLKAYREFIALYARYQESLDLINIGAYHQGTDPVLDKAIKMMPKFNHFLQQDLNESCSFLNCIQDLEALFKDGS